MNDDDPLERILDRLRIHGITRRTIHDDVRAAVAAGASVAEVARASGLTPQGIAKILARAAPPS